jgi:ABC-2 type transport system ATP-binding protein
VGLLSDGILVAVGTPDELRRQAFGGELIHLVLDGDPGHLGEALKELEGVGRVVEVRQDEEVEEAASRVRLLVEDADAAVPEVTKALNGADLRSLDLPKPSLDEVFFRLVRGTSEPV